MIAWGATLPVNGPDVDASNYLTEESLFNSLVDKALDPARFIPVIASCKVYEHDKVNQIIRRQVVFKGNPTPVLERITYHSPSLVTFDQLASSTDWDSPVVGTVLNIITVGANPKELYLTFTFNVQPNGPMGVNEQIPREELYKNARTAVKGTIEEARKH